MRFLDDDRGAAVQVGAIILFGFIVVAVAMWQATIVPQQNAGVEYTHSQRVQDDMQDVRNAIVSAPGSTTIPSVGVDMAPEYPPRTIFVNPGPATGTLRTFGTTDERLNLTVTGATATGEAGDYWDGSPNRYGTGGIVYEPGYNVYTSGPDTVYESSVLYNVENDGTVIDITGQSLVDGRTLTLITLDGSLSRTTSDTYSVDFDALSTSSTTVSVTDDGGPVTVSFASRREPAWWNATLAAAGELDEDGGHVVDVRAGSPATIGAYHNVTIELEAGVAYQLQMAKVGVGSGATDPGKHYIVDVAGDGSTVRTGTTRRLVVEVRDRYNNPVSGVEVELNDSDSDLRGGSLVDSPMTTGIDGRATFEYDATGATPGTATIVFNSSDDVAPPDRELVAFEVTVTAPGGGGGGGGGQPPTIDTFEIVDRSTNGQGARYDITWDVSDPDGDLQSVTVYANNTATGNTTTYSGPADSVTYNPSGSGDFGDELEFRIVATDDAGNRACYVITDIADGNPNTPLSKSGGDGTDCS